MSPATPLQDKTTHADNFGNTFIPQHQTHSRSWLLFVFQHYPCSTMWLKTFVSVLLCLCGTCFGVENGPSNVRVFVKEGSDVVLPCSLKNQNLNSALFDWNKVDPNRRKEVFFYEAGEHYNNGRGGQDPQFKGRVSHFGDELQHGNASIKIQNTKVEDSGIYRCYFPRLQPPQIFRVELMVDGILKDRSGSPGVAPAPDIKAVDASDEGTLLQCDVRGASPKPTVEWKNSDRKVLHTQEPQVTESKGRYNVTLLTTVDQTGHYRCVVTQEELHHQIHSETFVYISGGKKQASKSPWWGGFILGLVIGGVITFVAQWFWPVLRKRYCGGSADSKAGSKVDEEAVPLSTKDSSVIRVKEGSDAVLKCSPGSQDLTGQVFLWRKVDPKDLKKVFLYDAGKHYNGINGQDQQLKGHISHFGDELQHGNASIKIHNTKVEDRGIYTCYFPHLQPPQIFCLELVVGE